MLIHGRCHCGNLSFALGWEHAPTEIPARACSCSFCVKHGGVWTSDARASLVVTVRDRSLVSDYRFGTGTADFHCCARCGVVPVVSCRIDGALYAVVSVHAFEDADTALLRHAPASFEGEDTGSRMERRKRNWIADVEFR
jgi:hypothetical protein